MALRGTWTIIYFKSGCGCVRVCMLLHVSLCCVCVYVCACVCVGGGQNGVQDRGTDVHCIVAVCADGRGPGAAFVSLAFKSTRSHSAASCLPSPLCTLLLPPLLGGKAEMCVCVCVCGPGCLGLKEGFAAVPSAPPSLTGDCWRSQLASSWPIRSIWYRRRRRRRGNLVNFEINCFPFFFFFQSVSLVEY